MSKKETFKKSKIRKPFRLSMIDKVVYGLLISFIVISICGLVYFGKDYTDADREYQSLQESYVVEKSLDTSSHLRWNIDWASLYAINPDVVAWVIIPNTPISYPVVQTTDNTTYLKTTFEKEKNSCGAIFMDSRNCADFSDKNTVIYGHNMRNGSMFHALNSYVKEDFYKEHNEVWICTPYWQRKYKIISAHTTKDQSSSYDMRFASDEAYEAHIADEVSKSLYQTGNQYDTKLSTVTLSTCHGLHSINRMILVCQPEYEILVGEDDLKGEM